MSSPFLHCGCLYINVDRTLRFLQTPFAIVPPMHLLSLTHSNFPFSLNPGWQMHLSLKYEPFLHLFDKGL